jgi:protein SCO1/2
MNRKANPPMKFPARAAAAAAASLAAALMLAACSAEPPPGPSPDGVDLRGASIGGDFTLTSHTGKQMRWDDFAGQYRLVYFGFTYCPDICPTDVQRLSQGLTQFEKANPERGAKVQPIFITVDPERDTPRVMAEFVGNFHPRLIGLTGTPAAIAAAKTAFGAQASKDPARPDGSYNVSHTTFTYLFAPDGAPLGIIPTDKGAGGVAKELAQWVR